MTFIETLREATDIAHSAGLRFAVDAQVGWAFENISAAASRPTHMAVMDIVDEVTMMDYFSGCVDPLSTEGMPCHITQAMFFLAPFLTYANFLQRMHNRTVLLDVGLGVACETRLLSRFACTRVADLRRILCCSRPRLPLLAEHGQLPRRLELAPIPHRAPAREVPGGRGDVYPRDGGRADERRPQRHRFAALLSWAL